ncbi:hypothetical protein RSSM_00795 [Rhodopirellula sallentina SM41]|uniref:Uncharacterized protein n=1 Tax=Rhodopirellula sallentina SM41 TaxID=1263870 RepID=M5U8F5_9BACT|nr:hypothetical protein RSSM_00795 [Rhodopirellula sallentina SM41]
MINTRLRTLTEPLMDQMFDANVCNCANTTESFITRPSQHTAVHHETSRFVS